MVIYLTSENTDRERSIALSADDEKQVRDFISNIPRFNSVMNEFSRMMDEGQIEALSQALAALRFLKEGLNDEAIESISKMGGSFVEAASAISSVPARKVIESVSTEGNELSQLIEQIGRMHRDGVFDAVVNAAYALKFLKDGLNDEAVENIATTMSEMLTMWRQYSSTLSNPEFVSTLAKISKLERDGAIDAVVDSAYVLKFLRDGLNDEALTNIASIISQMLTQWNSLHKLIDTMTSSTADRIFRVLTDEGIEKRLEEATPRKGGMSLLSLSDPDVRKGMGVVFEMLKIIGEEFREDGQN